MNLLLRTIMQERQRIENMLTRYENKRKEMKNSELCRKN